MKFKYKYSYGKSDKLRPHVFWLPKNNPFYFTDSRYQFVIAEMIPWCEANLRAKSLIHPRTKGWVFDPHRLRLGIASEDDAFAFKMRWC